jgi:class 3 adenylate cyclase/pimeloyl-ACP methyl ester carboxylesterase
VNLAFCVDGQGPPLVYMPSFTGFGHIQMDAVFPFARQLLGYLPERMTVVRYDPRGQGLSDRHPADFSLEAHAGDVLTILDRLGLERAALLARAYGGPVGITLAHRYPERVSHLILWRTAPRLADVMDGPPRMQAVWSLLDQNWELFTEVYARELGGWPDPDPVGPRWAAQIRASTNAATIRGSRAVLRSWDATPLLSGIRAPTLIGHAPGPLTANDDRFARIMAAGIPGAELRIFDGMGEPLARAVYEFVSGEEAEPEPEAPQLPEGTAIILFTDIVDSTALTEQLGDAVFRARASSLDGAMRAGIRECGGTPVEGKVLGDGVMAVFGAARQAIEAAFRCRAAADGTGLALHLGIHAGDVTREGANVYGGAVNVASRICDLSANDEILVSGTVRDLARTSSAAAFEDRGEHQLKGIADAVRVYAVRSGGV